MSGSAGGSRISREAVQSTVNDYINKVLSKFPGFKQAKITGSYNTGDKKDFGDIDLVVQLEGTDKKLIKQELANYLATFPDSIIVPFKSEKYNGKKYLSSGELVTILYPINGYPGQFVQIDNIVSTSEGELIFKNTFLDYPAEIQGLLLGLAKVICLEEDPKSIFKRLGINNIPELGPNQEYEFNLSSSGLTLRIVTLYNFKETDRTEVWKNSDWSKIKLLFQNYNIDSNLSTLISDLSKKLTNPRSKKRVKGIFKSMVSIKSGEVNTPKGDNKQKALDSVDTLLENKPFKSLAKLLIKNLLPENYKSPKKTIALYGGKFKPPHKGHLEAVKSLMNKADEIVIIISPKEHEGITAQQSLNIWNNLFIPKLGLNKVKAVIASSPSPITQTLDTIEADQNDSYLAVYGKGEENKYKNVGIDPRYKNGKAEDVGVFQNDNVDISATGLRSALSNNEDITPWMPDGITSEEYKEALGLKKFNEVISLSKINDIDEYADDVLDPIDLQIPPHFIDRVNDKRNRPEIESDELYDFFDKLSDEKDELLNILNKGEEVVATDLDTDINIPLAKDIFKSKHNSQPVVVAKTIMRKQGYATSNKKLTFEQEEDDTLDIDENNLENNLEFKEKLVSLTLHMMEDGLNIEPLPDIVFIEDDEENANDILGCTAHYNPNDKSITLFTLKRHPKDILRSFAHEMIHHIQNLEGRIQGIEGQNINEDEYLKELEEEAYSKGNMCFRGWENDLKND